MRLLIAAPLLLAAACTVETDRRNGQATVGFDQNIITNATDQLGNAAASTANEIEQAGQDIRNQARGIDVNVDVRRQPPGNSTGNSN